jgi:hypothetical protein
VTIYFVVTLGIVERWWTQEDGLGWWSEVRWDEGGGFGFVPWGGVRMARLGMEGWCGGALESA